jgi:hypothetical protein
MSQPQGLFFEPFIAVVSKNQCVRHFQTFLPYVTLLNTLAYYVYDSKQVIELKFGNGKTIH